MSKILSNDEFETLRLDYAHAIAQTERGGASSYDDEEKARIGGELQAAYAALRAENARLREALAGIAEDGCSRAGDSALGQIRECREASMPRDGWCYPCRANAALAEVKP